MSNPNKEKGSRFERQVAKALGGTRTPLSGAVGGGDVSGTGYQVECKYRQKHPAIIASAFHQAETGRATGDPRPPLVVLGAPHQEALYVLREADFLNLLHEGGSENAWHVRRALDDIIKLARQAKQQAG